MTEQQLKDANVHVALHFGIITFDQYITYWLKRDIPGDQHVQ